MHIKKLLAVALLALTTSACTNIEIRTETTIDAPIETVWSILIDFERYPEWNPYHVMVEGEPVVGADLKVTVHRPDGKIVDVPPHILRIRDREELTWGGGIKGIFYGEHVFLLRNTESGGTHLSHNEDFSGFAVGFADLPPDVLTEGYERMNAALKKRAETLYQGRKTSEQASSP